MDWYLWIPIGIGGVVLYLGFGTISAQLVESMVRWTARDKGTQEKALSTIQAWGTILMWPFLVACLGVIIAAVLALLVALIAGAVAAIVVVLAFLIVVLAIACGAGIAILGLWCGSGGVLYGIGTIVESIKRRNPLHSSHERRAAAQREADIGER